MVGVLSPVNYKRILSGQKETFIKRYIVERTDKVEIRPAKIRMRNRRIVGGIYGMKYS